jgi:hypothetical protein
MQNIQVRDLSNKILLIMLKALIITIGQLKGVCFWMVFKTELKQSTCIWGGL